MINPICFLYVASRTNFADAHGLWKLYNHVRQLLFYNSAKVATSQGIPGAKAVYEELKRRFPRGKRQQDDPGEATQ